MFTMDLKESINYLVKGREDVVNKQKRASAQCSVNTTQSLLAEFRVLLKEVETQRY